MPHAGAALQPIHFQNTIVAPFAAHESPAVRSLVGTGADIFLIINRPGVAGAVLHTASSLID